MINPGDTIKSIQSLPKGEDGYIRRQVHRRLFLAHGKLNARLISAEIVHGGGECLYAGSGVINSARGVSFRCCGSGIRAVLLCRPATRASNLTMALDCHRRQRYLEQLFV